MEVRTRMKYLLIPTTTFVPYFCYILVMISDRGLSLALVLNYSVGMLWIICLKGLWSLFHSLCLDFLDIPRAVGSRKNFRYSASRSFEFSRISNSMDCILPK